VNRRQPSDTVSRFLAGGGTETRNRNLETGFQINTALTIEYYAGVNISGMPQESLRIDDHPGSQPGQRILRLDGALVMPTVFGFQSIVRADTSRSLIIDFTNVAYVDSAGIGALVAAYVTRQNGGRSLALVGVSERIHNALKVTHVEQFFRFFDSVSAAEEGKNSGQ
jgi:anti-sigma B factor antagonist